MMGFRLLDAATDDGRRRWLEAWDSWNGREVFGHPDYVALFAEPGDRVVCASWSGAGAILLPLVLRPVRRESWTSPSVDDWDATTPYGYGGAFSLNATPADTAGFWDAFASWASASALVSVFARLSLFEEQVVPFRGDIVEAGPNVVRTLELDDETLWRDYAHKVRKNVTRARRAGLRVEVDETGRRLDEFKAIYNATMQRRGAARRYHFSEHFFRGICEHLEGQFSFFHTIAGDRVVSSELVLVSSDYLYSFLGGTASDAFELRPNDLLKHEIIRWGRAMGRRAFVLGGGYEPDDGIFRYKLSFAPGGAVPFRTARLTIDAARYARLVEARARHEAAESLQWQPHAGMYPAYRA